MTKKKAKLQRTIIKSLLMIGVWRTRLANWCDITKTTIDTNAEIVDRTRILYTQFSDESWNHVTFLTKRRFHSNRSRIQFGKHKNKKRLFIFWKPQFYYKIGWIWSIDKLFVWFGSTNCRICSRLSSVAKSSNHSNSFRGFFENKREKISFCFFLILFLKKSLLTIGGARQAFSLLNLTWTTSS